MLPDGWKSTTLGEMNLDISDGNYSSKYPCASDFVKSGIPFLRANNIQSGTVNDEDMRYISIQKHDELQKGHLKKEDILITTRGDIGQISITPERHINSNINAQIVRINSNNLQINLYLFYYLSLCKINNKFEPLTTGTALKQLPIGRLKLLPILLPPLSEQKKIAAILSTWDRAIEGTEKLLANSQQQKKALMQQLLTGKKRLPGFTGEWIWKRSKEIFKSISIKNNPNTCELLSVTQDQGVVPRSSLDRRVVMPDGSVQGYKLVNPGNFIISLRSFQGGLEYSYYRGLVSPAYTVLDNKIEMENEFYKFYFKSYDFIGHLAVATIGIRDGKQISYEDFSFIKLPYPPLPEQKAIAAVLTTADEEITSLESDLSRLRQEKKALMQQLLTGKRRVRVN